MTNGIVIYRGPSQLTGAPIIGFGWRHVGTENPRLQHRRCDPDYARFLMASVDTVDEQREAAARGWRTFRLRRPGDQVAAHEVVCPASDEAGHRTTCAQCSLCQGADRQAKSIAILPHGQRTKWLDQVPA